MQGKTALVTGGTRGIGRAIADRLLRSGAQVVVTGTRAGFKPASSAERYLPVDFTDQAQLHQFLETVRGLGIDILVNNAGINKIAEFESIQIEDFDIIEQVNLRAPLLITQAVLPAMRSRGWGRIVNISSIFGVISREHRASYSSSKFALDGMTAALAAEVAPLGILANCVSPGFIDTELTHSVLGEKGIEELVKKVPIGRLGRPDEVAALVVWLAGAENTYLSGQNIIIDGGFCRV